MKIIKSIKSLRKEIAGFRNTQKKVGFVPTMGYFHAGHLSLMRKSKKENDITVVSLFVNPLQFGPKEDFEKYPRDFGRDKAMANSCGVDILFVPSTDEMYANRPLVTLKVDRLADFLCGASRPNHFDGVATVVAKLLNIIQPDKFYLGQKDAQQVVILKRVIKDLDFPTRLIVCPTVREKDGLAMSSRNTYLSTEERTQAPVLFEALNSAKRLVQSGERRAKHVEKIVKTMIDKSPDGRIDYVTCVDAETLQPLKLLRARVIVAVAVRFGKTRLIDNIIFSC